MAYAFEGGVCRDEKDGAVPITEEQYLDAISAMLIGKEVTLEGGFTIRDKQPSPDHTWENGEWIAPSEPTPEEPEQEPSTPILYAAAHILADSGFVVSINPVARLSGAFFIAPGKMLVFFNNALPDANYLVRAYGTPYHACILDNEKAEDYFVVTMEDANGNPLDNASVSIEVTRII